MNNFTMIILVGLPGSGKSTMCRTHFPNYIRINQDELGSRDKCIQECIKSLQQRKSVIIDRTNINKKQRSYWINLAHYHGVENIICVYLDVPEEECVSRIHFRKNHPTIKHDMSIDKKKSIVYTFNRDLEVPTLEEGFKTIVITRN